MNPIRVHIGPERIVLREGLQPFLFQTQAGRLVVLAQMPVPLGTQFPGVWGTMVSDDHGESWRAWTQEGIPGGSPFHEGCATQLRDGTILLLQWSARGPEPGGVWISKLWESRDNWESVQGPFDARMVLPEAKGGFDDEGHPVPEVFLHRSLIEMPDGTLLLVAYGWFHGDDTPSTYRPSMKKFRTLLLRSADRGRNWSLVSTVAADPTMGEEGYNEPVLVRVSRGPRAGRLIVHLRTGSNKTFKHCPIYQAESDDQGRTWTKPHALAWGNVDPDLIEMADGTLVASYGLRTWESRVHLGAHPPKELGAGHGNWLAFSRDSGETWEPPIQITKEPSSCYTTVREVSPGRLIYVYDIGDAWQHVWKGWETIQRGIGCRVLEVASSQPR